MSGERVKNPPPPLRSSSLSQGDKVTITRTRTITVNAPAVRLIAALLLVNRNGVAGESSPCDWVSFNRGEATLTSDHVAINRCAHYIAQTV